MMKSIALLVISILVIDAMVIAILYMQQTSKLTEARANIINLERKISTLTGDVETLRRDFSNMQAKLTESEAKAVTLQIALIKANADLVKAQEIKTPQAINVPDEPFGYVYKPEPHSPGMIPADVPLPNERAGYSAVLNEGLAIR